MEERNGLIPLLRVVAAAIVDSYEEKGKVESQYYHWATRTYRDLDRKYLKSGIRRTLLPVSSNTHTATLPADFVEETFIGTVINGEKVPLSLNTKLIDSKNLIEEDCVDKCPKCNQDKAICEDLEVTEEVNLIVIGSSTYEQTIIKKLYPNGDYYLETVNPVYNTETEEVDYITSKEFIANLDLKPCGCFDLTEDNLTTLQSCAPDVYACYYASCCNSCDVDLGGYKIFHETGLIQLSSRFTGSHLYLEYRGFLPKLNGQLHIPEIAFEAVVEGTKFRSIKNRKNVSNTDKKMYEGWALSAGRDMRRMANRISLSHIIEMAMTTPKFDIKRERWHNCFTSTSSTTTTSSSSTTETSTTTSSTTIEVTRAGVTFGKRKFTIGVSGSPMIEGQTVLIIRTEAGVAVPNILSDSVNILVDGVILQEGEAEQLSYTIAYGVTQTTITFNQGALDGQKYNITYAKTA